MQDVRQTGATNSTKEVRHLGHSQSNSTPSSTSHASGMEKIGLQVLAQIPETYLSPSDDEEVSEVESFIIDQEEDLDDDDTSRFLLSSETIEGADVRTVDPETQARLEALLEAAGIGKLSTLDGKALADPEVLRRLTSSVSCALDEAAAALTRMRAEQQSELIQGEGTRSLAKACSNGDIGTVRQLLDEGRSVHETTEEGESLLSLACSAGYYELAQVLIAMRANVEDRGIKGDCTPLMEAASGGYVDIVRLLIVHGGDTNAQSSAGNTPLHYAACGGHEDVVRVLIDGGGNVEEHNENGHTPLMEAASAGHVSVAKILLKAGAGINTHSNEFKESALTLACYKGHLEMVKFLLEAGADQEHKTDEMHTALMEAAMDGHVEVARLLLDSGAQVNMPADSFESPLTLAACGGHVELANLLIDRGANLEEVNDEGYTPLMEAAREGHDEMVALLLARGADINAQTEETQETALTLACCGGFSEVAEFLLKAGADIELGCSTPLMEGAQEGHLELVKFLIKASANVHAQTQTGDTALTYACENGHTDVAEVLLDSGAELEHESEGGRTPLMKAARAGHRCTVQFLISKGADVNRTTSTNDHTVLSLACAGGHLGVVELLLQSGGDPTHKLKDGSTMLIEAAKGGHVSVVTLLLDWPNSLLSPSSDLAQLSPPQSSVDMTELSRVPMQGLSNVVPPQDPNQVPAVSDNYAHDIQSNQLSGQINLKDLKITIPKQSIEEIKEHSLSRDKGKQENEETMDISSEEDSNSAALTLNGQFGEIEHDLDVEYEEEMFKGDSPVSLDLDEQTDAKASAYFESTIGKMMMRAELLNTSREEQLFEKQQILEKLQMVEQEIQEKAKQQLILSRQAKEEEEKQKRLQQLLQEKSSDLPAVASMDPTSHSNPSANSRNMLPLQVAYAGQLETCFTDAHSEQFAGQPLTELSLVSSSGSLLPEKRSEAIAIPQAGEDGVKTPVLAKQESLSSASSADSGCGNSDTNGLRDESSQADGSDGEDCNQGLLTINPHLLIDPATEDHMLCLPNALELQQQVGSRASSEEVDFAGIEPASGADQPQPQWDMQELHLQQVQQQLHQLVLQQQSQALAQNPNKDSQKNQNTAIQHEVNQLQQLQSPKPLPGAPPMSVLQNFHIHGDPLQQPLSPLTTIPVQLEPLDLSSLSNMVPASSASLDQSLQLQHSAQLRAHLALQQQLKHQHAQLQQQQKQVASGINQGMTQQQTIATSTVQTHQQQLSSQELQNKLKLQLQTIHQRLQHVPQQLMQLELLQEAQQLQQQLQELEQIAVQQQQQQQVEGQVLQQVSVSHNQISQAATQVLTQQDFLQQAQQLQQQLQLQQKLQKTQQLVQYAAQNSPDVISPPNSCVTVSSQSGTVATAISSSCVANGNIKNPVGKKLFQPLQQLPQQSQSQSQLQLTQEQQQQLQLQLQQTQLAQNQQVATYANGIGNNTNLYDYYLDMIAPSTPVTPNPSPASPQISPPVYPTVELDAQTESNHDTALTLACAGGHAELVTLLLTRGADIEHRDKKGFTPLILGATAGHADVVEILLDNGAEIEAQSERTKDTPLSLACSGGRYEVVDFLLARCANKEHRNVSDYTPLSLAASGGYVNIIKLLLSHGAEINSRTGSKLGISPLMLAAMNGHTAAVKLLLDMGSDINAQIETNRNTALTLACFQGRHEVVSLLVDRKANIEHRAKTGLTPLMEAASGGYVEVGRVLLDKGADVNAPPVPSSRDTALTIAADKGHYRFVELLISRGAAIDVKNKKGNSPLWLACNGGHADVVQLLVNASADVDSQDNRKVSCLMAAFRKGHIKVVKWLVKHVTQFPSDQECMRFVATITDKELLKKCHQCMEIIVSAKDRQAEEANKNATILLEEIDLERSREESKRAAAARKREKRRKKKKEKQEKEREQKEKEKDGHSKNSSPEPEEITMEEINVIEVEEKEPEIIENKMESRIENVNDVTPINTVCNEITEVLNTAREEDNKLKCKMSNKINNANVNTTEKSRTGSGKSKRKRREKNRSNDAAKRSSSVTEANLENKGGKGDCINVNNVDTNRSAEGSNNNNKTNGKPDLATISTTGIGDLDDFGTLPRNIKVATVKEEKKKAITEKNSRVSSLDTFGVPLLSPVKSGIASQIKTPQGTPSPKKGQKKESDGWKEVIRKSKKVSLPASAMNRVMGRGGSNINAIREVSGANIEIDKPKGSGDRVITIKGSADATRQAHNLVTALIKDSDKEIEQVLPKVKNRVISTNTDTITSNMWHNSMASNVTSSTPLTSVSEVLSSTSGKKSSSSKAAPTTSRSSIVSTVSQSTTESLSASTRQTCATARTQQSVANFPIGVWGAPAVTSSNKVMITPKQAISASSVLNIHLASRSPGSVARQLFPSQQSAVPASTTTKTTVTYSSPSMAKTMVVATTMSSSPKAENRSGQMRMPMAGTSSKVEPQPLPIKTSSGQSLQANKHQLQSANQSQHIQPPGEVAPAEYSPFNNLFSQVAEQVMKKEETESRMNFASVAAAGVVTTTSAFIPNARQAPIMASNVAVDPELQAKAPGYKAPGQRTSSPQVTDNNLAKAPGYRGNLLSGSQLGRSQPDTKSQNYKNSNMPVQYAGSQMMNDLDSLIASHNLNMHKCISAQSVESLPGYCKQFPSQSSHSPRSNNSTPAGLHTGNLFPPPQHKEEYSMPNQPMTLPKIESNLNPNAPDFTSRAIFLQQHHANLPHFNALNNYNSTANHHIANPLVPPHSFSSPPPSLGFGGLNPHKGNSFGGTGTNMAMADLTNTGSGGTGLGGLLHGQYGGGTSGLTGLSSAPRPYSPIPATVRPSSAGQPSSGRSRDDSELSPQTSNGASPVESARFGGGERILRPIGMERISRTPPGLHSMETGSSGIWPVTHDSAADWLSSVSTTVVSTSVVTSSVVNTGLPGAPAEEPRPASHPQVFHGSPFPVELGAMDATMEQTLQASAAVMVSGSAAPIFANGLPSGGVSLPVGPMYASSSMSAECMRLWYTSQQSKVANQDPANVEPTSSIILDDVE